MKEKEGLDFPLLTDPDLALMAAYGVVNPKGKGKVPHPTVMLIDKAGIVQFIHLDEDYSKRPTPQQVLDAVGGLGEHATD